MSPAEVLQTMEKSMAMKTGEWLEEQISNGKEMVLLDLRGTEAFSEEHIPGSVNLSIQDLPRKMSSIIPDKKALIVCICNGSVQSAMAVMFLRTENYKSSYNLSGGFSGWVRNNRPVHSFASGSLSEGLT